MPVTWVGVCDGDWHAASRLLKIKTDPTIRNTLRFIFTPAKTTSHFLTTSGNYTLIEIKSREGGPPWEIEIPGKTGEIFAGLSC
jgi:hypothetical protein